MLIRSISVDNGFDAVRLGSASGLLWRSERLSIAGFGKRFCFGFTSLDEFDTAFQTLRDSFDSDIDFHAFASLNFSVESPGEIVLPQYTYVDDGNPRVLVVGEKQIDLDVPDVDITNQAAELVARADAENASSSATVQIRPDDTELWKSQISTAVESISATGLNKVVMARRLIADSDQLVSIPQICQRLDRAFASSLLFVHDGFVGASPEMLIAKVGDSVSAHPLAGTAKRTGDDVADETTKESLLKSTKDQWEHRVTIDWFLDTLLEFCSFVDAEPSPTIVELANVFHLGTKVAGRLSTAETSISELVTALHPTPAVGGEPQSLAVAKISELEKFDRGRYAGPTGWLNQCGDGEFAVAIRSAQIESNKVELFAGVGVVADSDPTSELAETEAKFAAMFSGLAI